MIYARSIVTNDGVVSFHEPFSCRGTRAGRARVVDVVLAGGNAKYDFLTSLTFQRSLTANFLTARGTDFLASVPASSVLELSTAVCR
ncbi:hypothetical protein EVAR_37360_1 [Eumeta japonica]|uniref:Uncharacterized protein n=1 Tax=Eumeta variegata TaxID=151549 RepID=A0A4C1X1U6_EUMVA|nr:hypothetical protein EVAR_37360_1 [Eumeta japonica]